MEGKQRQRKTGMKTKSGSGGTASIPAKYEPRIKLDNYLRDNPGGINFASKFAFRMMNRKMQNDGIEMEGEHADAIIDSFSQRRGLFRTLWAENPFVMRSTGDSCTYFGGRYFVHSPLHFARRFKNWWSGEDE